MRILQTHFFISTTEDNPRVLALV